MLGSQQRETRSVNPGSNDRGETDSTYEGALRPAGKENRQDPSETTHQVLILWSALRLGVPASRRRACESGIKVDRSRTKTLGPNC
jgi:hypothetical protein